RSSPAVRSGGGGCARRCSSSRTCCCWTSRPTISTPKRARGSRKTLRNFPAPSWGIPTNATFSITSPNGMFSRIRAREFPCAGIPWEGNYSSWLAQKQKRLATEEKQASARQKTLERELEWVRMAPKARHAKSKARIQRYEELRAESEKQTEGSAEIIIPVPER